jgi:hypothetical protein
MDTFYRALSTFFYHYEQIFYQQGCKFVARVNGEKTGTRRQADNCVQRETREAPPD